MSNRFVERVALLSGEDPRDTIRSAAGLAARPSWGFVRLLVDDLQHGRLPLVLEANQVGRLLQVADMATWQEWAEDWAEVLF